MNSDESRISLNREAADKQVPLKSEPGENNVSPTGLDRWIAAMDGGLRRRLESRSSSALLVWLLCLASAVLLFKLGAAPVARSPEIRVLAVSHTMLESGNWLVPYLDGTPRLQKPPLYYWMTSLLSVPAGEVSNWSLRLPSVFSAVLLLIVVYRWGRAISGPALGLMAVLLILGTGQFWVNGRLGTAEMLLALFCTTALFVFDRMRTGRNRKLLPWFALACALAFLAKATVAILVIGLPVVLQITRDRAWRSVWQKDVIGWMTLSLLACLGWYLVILLRVPDALKLFKSALVIPLGGHTIEGDSKHYRPFYFYFGELPGAFAATLLCVPLLFLQRRAQLISKSPSIRFAATSCIVLFVAFCIIPAKQRHYLLPILPLFALALADGIIRLAHDVPDRFALWLRRAGPVLLVLGILMSLWGVAYLALLMHETVLCWASVLILGVSLSVAAHRSLRRARFHATAGIFAAMALLIAIPLWLDFDLWQVRFRENVMEKSPGFHAREWQRLFDIFPPMRKMMRAEKWHGTASDASPVPGASQK